ncbi:MAG: hypothetical protein GY853_13380 [PVC group bacterium]|nr:hypothetical protein [PVC group bacterium]
MAQLAEVRANLAANRAERRGTAAEFWETGLKQYLPRADVRADRWRNRQEQSLERQKQIEERGLPGQQWYDQWEEILPRLPGGGGNEPETGLGSWDYESWMDTIDRGNLPQPDTAAWQDAVSGFDPTQFQGAANQWIDQWGQFGPAGSTYSGDEANALARLSGLGGAGQTGGEFTNLMSDVRAGIGAPSGLQGQLERKYRQALAPGLTGAGKEYYNALDLQMQVEEEKTMARVFGDLANQNMLGGSMEFQARENLLTDMNISRNALLAGIKREDSKEAANWIMQDRGFILSMAGVAKDLASISGQTEIAAMQTTLGHIANQSATAVSQANTALAQGELDLQAQLAQITSQAGLAQGQFGMETQAIQTEADIQNMYQDNFSQFLGVMLPSIFGLGWGGGGGMNIDFSKIG